MILWLEYNILDKTNHTEKLSALTKSDISKQVLVFTTITQSPRVLDYNQTICLKKKKQSQLYKTL